MTSAEHLALGLTTTAAARSRAAHGDNVVRTDRPPGLLLTLKDVFCKPMFPLLLSACAVYVGLGRTEEAVTLGVAQQNIGLAYHRRADPLWILGGEQGGGCSGSP